VKTSRRRGAATRAQDSRIPVPRSADGGNPPAVLPWVRTRHLIAAGALLLAAFLAFSNSFSGGFILDSKQLLGDPRIRAATGENLRLILQHTYWWPLAEAGLYRPFTTLSYLFNYAVLGNADQPGGYHWLNFLLHAGNVLLVYVLAWKLVRKFWPSVFIAGIWAVHPVLTESVTNIIGRADLLAAMATLSGFLMYLKSAETSGSRRIGWLAGLMAVTAVGAFSKESAVVIPAVIAVFEFLGRKERRQGSLGWGLVATLAPIIVMLYARSRVLAASPPAQLPFVDNPIAGAGFWNGRLTALAVLGRYLWLIVWPVRLSNDYSYAQIPLVHGSVLDWMAWITLCVLVLAVAVLYKRDNRISVFFACFAFVAILPVSNLLFPIGTIMAERLLYLPAVGWIACLVLAIYNVAEQTLPSARAAQASAAILCIVAIGLAILTRTRNEDWQSEAAMAAASVQNSPNSFKVHRLLASVLFESDSSESNLDRVIGEVEKSVAILDPLPDARSNSDTYRLAGGSYLLKGDLLEQKRGQQEGEKKDAVFPEAAQSYRRALQLLLRCIAIGKSAGTSHADPEAYQMLSAAYLRVGEKDQAYRAAKDALYMHPGNAGAYRQIAYVFLAQDKIEEAAAALIQGSLISSDTGLVKDTAVFFQKALDPTGCATIAGPDGPVINPTCEVVRKHFCAVSVDVIQAQLQSGHRDLALVQKLSFVKDFGCAPGPLDQLFAGK